jgi:hypothetical protein
MICPKKERPLTVNQSPGDPLFPCVWKTCHQGRIKPVIARDTTYSVSLLTCTTGGSNFAIPSTEISPHGNGAELEESSQQ